MNFSSQHGPGLYRQAIYTIQVEGRLTPEWSAFFGEMEITESNNEQGFTVTTLTKTCADQSELYALLIQLRDLGLPLLSVMCKKVEGEFTPEYHPAG